jgi:hypothetical protein
MEPGPVSSRDARLTIARRCLTAVGWWAGCVVGVVRGLPEFGEGFVPFWG